MASSGPRVPEHMVLGKGVIESGRVERFYGSEISKENYAEIAVAHWRAISKGPLAVVLPFGIAASSGSLVLWRGGGPGPIVCCMTLSIGKSVYKHQHLFTRTIHCQGFFHGVSVRFTEIVFGLYGMLD